MLIIIDKKYGRKEVTPAEANMQLRSYAVMGAKRWTPDKILVSINQPRLKFEDRLSMAEYTKDEIPAARDHILRVWDAAHAPNAPRIAGFEQCRYCKAKLICDAYRAKYDSSLPRLKMDWKLLQSNLKSWMTRSSTAYGKRSSSPT